jgi:2-C-methyl-D-erythritol 2,4-cyclodiphosphate synthase
MLKAGLGYDLHRLVYGRDLYIGGVKLESRYGAKAHSDGDTFIHALVDSLLSPIGAPDIGALYPEGDPVIKGISSINILSEVRDRYLKSVEIVNIDGVVILESPKIYPYIPEMKKVISKVLGIPADRIGIKGKTTEHTRLFTVECYCMALIDIN